MSFSFYYASTDYCDFLRESDRCVPYTMESKTTRPFVGIVFSIKQFDYYSPLTSPKPKHLHMKNQVDFLKINNGIWGAINFNNMIPIHNKSLQKVEMKILPSDSQADIDYKNLLSNQLSWCNSNRTTILTQAEKLYNIISQGKGRPELISRCCNFPLDESQYLIFCHKNGLLSDTPTPPESVSAKQ